MGLDAIFEPVGPQPARVYWVRRGVLIVVLIVLLLVVKSCAGGSSPTKGTGATVTGAGATPSASASAVSPAATSTSPAAPVSNVVGCNDTQLSLTVTSNGTKFPSGAPPQLTLVVKNSGPGACSEDVSGGSFGFVVSSGTDRIWSSTDCASVTPVIVVLKANETRQLTVPWNRHRSDTACSAAKSQILALPGTYTVKGVLRSLSQPGPTIILS